MSDATYIVEVKNIKVLYKNKQQRPALDNISLQIKRGETLGVIGESGSGKTTLGLSILRLVKINEGKILFKGIDITNWKENQLRKIRRLMQLVPQDPYSSMNPKLRIKDILVEPLLNDNKTDNMNEKIDKVLEQVGLDQSIKDRLPSELSGGQRQRVLIARALIGDPEFMVLDEPTSNLDVSIQAQILNLLLEVQEKRNLSYLFITHNLLVAKYMTDRLAVLYSGKLLELSEAKEIIKNPLHPYTIELIEAVPSEGFKKRLKEKDFQTIELKNKQNGCVYLDRCKFSKEICKTIEPNLKQVKSNHWVACHLYT